MNCPFCQNADTKVLDSRPDAEGRTIRRRRECFQCSKRWRTVERVEDEMPLVIKKDGTYQTFDRAKLLNSLTVATGKRPVSKQQLEDAAANIEWNLLAKSRESVSTVELGEEVMRALKALDEIAYIRFASVYRRFKDVGEMMAEMQDLLIDDNKNLKDLAKEVTAKEFKEDGGEIQSPPESSEKST